jgi:hypothetical protein
MRGAEYLKEQAERCRRLARQVLDPALQRRLFDLAREFEEEAEALLNPENKEPRCR